MNWDLLTLKWRRMLDYVKSKLEPDGSEHESEESSLLGKGWPGRDGRIAFPPVLEPALAKIPRT